MPKNKSNFLIPVIGTTVVVAVGVAAYFYFKGSLGDNLSPLASAKLVPDKALMTGFISTDEKVWSQLKQFGNPEAQKVLEKGLQDLDQKMLSDANISYEEDLKPWIGNIMFAILPPSAAKPVQETTPQTAQANSNVLLIIGIRDKISALNFANKVKAEKGTTTKELDYKGVKITESLGQKKATPTYTAVVNDHLLVGLQEKAVEEAIDTSQGAPSFVTKEGANDMLTKGADIKNPLAQVYIPSCVPDCASVAQQLLLANPSASQMPPQTVAQFKQWKSGVMSLGIDDGGLRLKVMGKLDSQATKIEYQPTEGKVVSQLPAETMAFYSGQGINKWPTLAQNNPESQQKLDQIRQSLKTLNIDLDKDIFGWMDGEFAFAMIPSNQGILASVGFGGVLVIDTSDRKTAEAAFTKLDTLAKSQSLNVTQRNIDGKDVTEWQVPQGGLLGHGWLEQNRVFIAFGGPISDVIATKPSQPLDSSETFKAVTGSLQKPNAGYIYLDMDKTMFLVNKVAALQNQPIPPEASAILSSIRGVGLTGTQPDKATIQMEMLLALKPSSH